MYDEHQRRISEVDHVEKHLIMAKAAALAAEEKALSMLDQQLGIPKGNNSWYCKAVIPCVLFYYFRSMPIAT